MGNNTKMTSKERMLLALDHKKPDRVPYRVNYVPEVITKIRTKY